ncbi:MAG: hypothetical protein IJ608_08895 [Lachnospiraceae bacterium]|nr:hypothetical protein [Lachnospiraceae bacterium]
MKTDNNWKPKYSLAEIKTQLDAEEMSYEIIDTLLEQNQTRYKRGKKWQFEENLCNKGIEYFAYIKFFEADKNKCDDNSLFAIVAGKSGSKKVNAYGSDVRFMVYPKHGKAKKWLYDNNKRWYQPLIVVIKARNKGEAFEIEKQLIERFGLLES